MHDFSPLCPSELRAIEENLNAGDLERAQRQLAELVPHGDLEPGTAYLATRLLFLRGRLDAASVVDRMRELVGAHPTFSEAQHFMAHCQSLLRAAGSDPPRQVTPRPRSLFPSAPPDLATAVTSLSTRPADPSVRQSRVDQDLDPPWSGTDLDEGELLDSDRPTFEPELEPGPDDRASLAPTEFPSALGAPSLDSSRARFDNSSREIRVDTRQSFTPSAGSLPPPSLYSPGTPRPIGRYSHGGRHDREDQGIGGDKPSARIAPAPDAVKSNAEVGSELGGRYRLSNLSSDVIPIPLVSGKTLPRFTEPDGAHNPTATIEKSPAARQAPKHEREPDRPTPFRVPRPVLQEAPSEADELSHDWRDPERQFIQDPRPARARLEQRALELLEPYPSGFEDFDERAAELATLLSSGPVIHYFAPFDRSLCSLSRLELALRTIYGSTGTLPTTSVRPLLALYLGDVLRTSHRGTWRGDSERPSSWAVEAGAHIWQPFRSTLEVLSGKPGHALLTSLGPGLARRGTVAWMSRVAANGALPKPWRDPLTPQKQTELGQWVRKSPWSACCESVFGQALDGSVESLRALDQLLDILFDSSEAPKALDPWLTRAATMAGAYVGIVLGVGRTATWVERESQNGERYLGVELSGGLIATPIVNIITRATSRKRSQLNDYVRALMRRAH